MTEYKGYNIRGDGTFGMKTIHTVGRGSLPNDLKGSYSSEGFAKKAIDISLGRKENTNGKVSVSD